VWTIGAVLGALRGHAQQRHARGRIVPKQRRVMEPAIAGDGLRIATKLTVADAIVVCVRGKAAPASARESRPANEPKGSANNSTALSQADRCCVASGQASYTPHDSKASA
jgi:hypothetical protein